MADEEITYYERRGKVKPYTKREFDAFPGLADTLKAQGFTKITPAKAAKIADTTAQEA